MNCLPHHVWFILTFNCCSVVFTKRFAPESVTEGTNALDDSSRIVQLERDVRILRKTLASKLWIYDICHLSCSMDILSWNVARTITVFIGTILASSQWNWSISCVSKYTGFIWLVLRAVCIVCVYSVTGKGNSYCSVHRLQLEQYNDSTMAEEEMTLGLQGAKRI